MRLKKSETDALMGLRTIAKTVISALKLDIPTFNALDIDSIDFVHSSIDTGNQCFVSLAANRRKAIYPSTYLAILAQKQLYDDFCQQIRERLKEEKDVPFPTFWRLTFWAYGTMERIHSYSKIVTEMIIHIVHRRQNAGRTRNKAMFFVYAKISVDLLWVSTHLACITWWRIPLLVLTSVLKNWKRSADLKSFSTTEKVAYININIVGTLLESDPGITAVLVIAELYLKPTKTVSFCTTTAHNISAIFTKHCFILYGHLIDLLFDNAK